jgi:hypothetical protein
MSKNPINVLIYHRHTLLINLHVNALCSFHAGEAIGKVWVVLFVTIVNAQTMALYGCFSNLISMRGDVPRATGLGIGAGMGLLNVYKWCNEAQNVEQCVSSLCDICLC